MSGSLFVCQETQIRLCPAVTLTPEGVPGGALSSRLMAVLPKASPATEARLTCATLPPWGARSVRVTAPFVL